MSAKKQHRTPSQCVALSQNALLRKIQTNVMGPPVHHNKNNNKKKNKSSISNQIMAIPVEDTAAIEKQFTMCLKNQKIKSTMKAFADQVELAPDSKEFTCQLVKVIGCHSQSVRALKNSMDTIKQAQNHQHKIALIEMQMKIASEVICSNEIVRKYPAEVIANKNKNMTQIKLSSEMEKNIKAVMTKIMKVWVFCF